MADSAKPAGRGFGRGRGGRGRGRGGGRGRGRREDDWTPVTKLGRLVKSGRISNLEEIYKHSLPIKEAQIIDYFIKDLKDEVMKISPVQKQTRAGQRTRFKAYVVVGDSKGHCGLGVKVAGEVATAIRGAITAAKLSIIPVRLGYWGNMIGDPHTIPCKVTGKCGSIRVRLIPAPRGTGVVAAPVPKKLLQFSGLNDVYTNTQGSTKTLGNFVKATFDALVQSYAFLTPDLWAENEFVPTLFEAHSDFLSQKKKAFTSDRDSRRRPRRS
eukprot:gb/GECH01011218.1/.p1 GENE.gb/GECH01011218.1/~~gb/GECH01011218.1/.p1  ORF type:complete len:269 (+),score=43.99 gb/GECH01011218.1/:1-807(+)